MFGGCILCECVGKGVGGQPDPATAVGLEFRRLRVRRIAVEDVGDGFPLVGSQGGDVDQGVDPAVTGRADNTACVGMAGEDDTPDFLFPQMNTSGKAPPDWRPTFFDYFYVHRMIYLDG